MAPAYALATWFGSGYSPFAPGTAGTAATLPLVWLLGMLPAWDAWSPWCLVAALLLWYPALWSAGVVEKAEGKHDPGKVVIDETLGTLLTLGFLPLAALSTPWVYVAAFFLFRLLDVWKPGPIYTIQKLPGGLGIVADDVLAGILGGVIMRVAWLVWG